MITRDKLTERLDYDPVTGVFRWRRRPGHDRCANTWNGRFCGAEAGTVLAIGYRNISIDGRLYYAHRLAWFYTHGRWPKEQIDHIDGDRLNNAMSNLREATNAQNSRNRGVGSTNTSGIKGVSWSKVANKWWAQIQHNKRHYHLGFFICPREAADAYRSAAHDLHEDFANTGRG